MPSASGSGAAVAARIGDHVETLAKVYAHKGHRGDTEAAARAPHPAPVSLTPLSTQQPRKGSDAVAGCAG